jgi:hypothetical protein
LSRNSALVLVCLAAGCHSTPITSSLGDVVVGEKSIEFPDAFVGSDAVRELAVRNTSRSERKLKVSTSDPFRIESADVLLPGGASVPLRVTFSPTVVGEARGALQLTLENAEVAVALRGVGLAAPSCGVAGICKVVAFDAEQQRCVETEAPDGLPCGGANACLSKATCRGGTCVGMELDCEDGNACTVDACDASSGCVHFDSFESCAAPLEPCKVPRCDRVSGCGFTDAADGTSCGPHDCVTAAVCIQGLCQTRPVPEGATCAPETPCQAKGICTNKACIQPPPTELVEEWSQPLEYYANSQWGGGYPGILFPGVADEAGNVYWAECLDPAGPQYFGGGIPTNSMGGLPVRCQIVSTTSTGLERFREPSLFSDFGARSSSGKGSLFVLAGQTLVIAHDYGWIEAVRASDGYLLWWRDLSSPMYVEPKRIGVGEVPWTLKAYHEVSSLLWGGGTTLIAVTHSVAYGTAQVREARVDFIEVATGKVTSAISFLSHFESAVMDEAGNLFTGMADLDPAGNRQDLLASISSTGTLRWRVVHSQSNPLAVFNGRMFSGWSEVSDATHGAALYTLGLANPGLQSGETQMLPLLVGAEGYAISGPGVSLTSFNVANGTARWTQPLHPDSAATLTQPLATQGGGVLISTGPSLAQATNGERFVLRSLAASGAERFSCKLPAGRIYQGTALLQGERWIVWTTDLSPSNRSSDAVRAFKVPGVHLVPKGWVTRGGDRGRTGRPR